MRKKCTDQVSIFDLFSNHDIGKELKAMSERLDRHREILDWVAVDLHLKDVYDTGRQGLPAESVLSGIIRMWGHYFRQTTLF